MFHRTQRLSVSHAIVVVTVMLTVAVTSSTSTVAEAGPAGAGGLDGPADADDRQVRLQPPAAASDDRFLLVDDQFSSPLFSPTGPAAAVAAAAAAVDGEDTEVDADNESSTSERLKRRPPLSPRLMKAFRSDLGKRFNYNYNFGDSAADSAAEEFGLRLKRSHVATTSQVRGKSAKSDVGKRANIRDRSRVGGMLFRSDLGRRSVPIVGDLYHDVRESNDVVPMMDSPDQQFEAMYYPSENVDDELTAASSQQQAEDVEQMSNNNQQVKRRVMFRSDLGKRSTAMFGSRPLVDPLLARLFKADLGKRRLFRHDLG